MMNFDLEEIEKRHKEGKHPAVDLLMLIEKAIELQGSAAAFLNAYNESKIKEVVRLKKSRKNKKAHKLVMRYLRIRVRIDNGLPIYKKGGTLFYCPEN